MTGIPNIGCQRVNQPEIKVQNTQLQDVIKWCFYCHCSMSYSFCALCL